VNALLATIRNRLISDFLMRPRLNVYGRLLEAALTLGYQFHTVGGIWHLIRDGALDLALRHLVLRHDVDTDPRTAAAMWEIDRALGIQSSYFFRLSTLAPALMARIAAGGGEASYHYEELATVVKRRGLGSRSAALQHLPEARALFGENLMALREMTSLPMQVVASHGDFVNTRLQAPNWLILDDASVRAALGIELETYDRALLDHLPARITDRPYPRYWDPRDPVQALSAGEPVISLLVHPRHWRVDWVGNVRDDLRRAVDGARFVIASSRRGDR
jgi:hypothetical protein